MTMKSPRAVFAELLLIASPLEMGVRRDGVSLRIEFATIAELRAWLDAAGLNTPDVLFAESEGTFDDGRPYRTANAYPTWHGREIYAEATEKYDPPAVLDADVREGLTALVVAG